MEFEWDSSKDAANRAKHEVSFAFALRVCRDPGLLILEVTRPEDNERRWKAIGLIGNRLFSVVFTARGEATRIISARRTNHSEDRLYGHR
jgi:uncharacterized protein